MALSVPTRGATLVGTDGTHVYWRLDATAYRRASRDGDGSDVESLQADAGATVFAGYLWAIRCTAPGTGTPFAVTADAIHFGFTSLGYQRVPR